MMPRHWYSREPLYAAGLDRWDIALAYAAVLVVFQFSRLTAVIVNTTIAYWMSGTVLLRVVAALTVIPAFSTFAAIPTVRMLLRVFPVRFDSGHIAKRPGCLSALAILGTFLLASVWSIQSEYLLFMPGPVGPAHMSAYWLSEGWLALAVCITAFYFYRAGDLLLTGRYVLFLRRFSTYADRAVAGVLLRNLGSGVRLVQLIPRGAQVRDWDFLALGFYGLSLRRPICSVPVYLRAPIYSWEAVVQRAARNASAIVVDVSDISDSVRVELDIVHRYKHPEATLIYVREERNRGSSDKTSTLDDYGYASAHVPLYCYRRSPRTGWIRAVIIGAIAVAFTIVVANPYVRDGLLNVYFLTVLEVPFVRFQPRPEGMAWIPWVWALVYLGACLPLVLSLARDSLTHMSEMEIAVATRGLVGK